MIDMDSSIRKLYDEKKISARAAYRQGDRQDALQGPDRERRDALARLTTTRPRRVELS